MPNLCYPITKKFYTVAQKRQIWIFDSSYSTNNRVAFFDRSVFWCLISLVVIEVDSLL